MEKLIESRKISVTNKTLRLKEVKMLAQIIWDQYQHSGSKNNHASVTFILYAKDESEFTSQNINIFDEDSIINQKRIIKISMKFIDYTEETEVRILLDGINDTNHITVTGADSYFINGLYNKFNELIISFSPQDDSLERESIFIVVCSSFLFGFLFFLIFDLLNLFLGSAIPTKNTAELEWVKFLKANPTILFLLQLVAKFIAGLPLGLSLKRTLKTSLSKFWPKVEIQIGPEHTYKEKIFREKFNNLIYIWIVPILLSIVYDVFKTLYNI